MRDPFSWSFPVTPPGFLFGVTVRVHFLLPLFMAGMVLRAATMDKVIAGTWHDIAWLMVVMFFAILCHEFGHVMAARRVEGEANEVLLWPLGGLARCDVPHTARANFITALGGPLMNVVLCVGTALALALLLDRAYQPIWNPFPSAAPYRVLESGEIALTTWGGESVRSAWLPTKLLAQFFWVNWTLLLLNLVLVGFPFDGGRMLQAALWPSYGYRQATLYAVGAGFILFTVLLLLAIIFIEPLIMLLAWVTYTSCKQEWLILEGNGGDQPFGYDFSQGYTSLEKDEPLPRPRRKKQNFLQRWLQRRAARKMVEEQERQQADETRMDNLLDKIQRYGKQALTDEEHRFLKRVSDRYKNRPF